MRELKNNISNLLSTLDKDVRWGGIFFFINKAKSINQPQHPNTTSDTSDTSLHLSHAAPPSLILPKANTRHTDTRTRKHTLTQHQFKMEIQERSSGKIYSLSSTATLPEWLSDRSKRNLNKTDSSYRHRITLLQDLEMPASSSRVRQSPDGQFLVVAGTYAPRIRCYELQEMSMKFERYLDSEVVDLLILGEDYGKLAILGNDRSVSFHAPYGFHSSIRLPTFGRAMAYEKSTCDLLVVSSGKRGGTDDVAGGRSMGQVYRFNLDEGRFSQTLTYDSALRSKSFDGGRTLQLGGSCIAVSPTHSLTAIGAEDGTVRFWDNRAPVGSTHNDLHLTPFLNLDVASATSMFGFFDDTTNMGFSGEVTSICFDSSGVHMCAGTKGGNVALYDMRSSKPLFIKEHQYGLPIHTVQFHAGSRTVLSSDAKLVKIWNAKGSASAIQRNDDWNDDPPIGLNNDMDVQDGALGSIVANVEGTADFTHFLVAGDSTDVNGHDSGLLLCTGEQSKVQSFYCPMLGPAPKWVSFIENITEGNVMLNPTLVFCAIVVFLCNVVINDYFF